MIHLPSAHHFTHREHYCKSFYYGVSVGPFTLETIVTSSKSCVPQDPVSHLEFSQITPRAEIRISASLILRMYVALFEANSVFIILSQA